MQIIADYYVQSKMESLPDGVTVDEVLDDWNKYAPYDLDLDSAEIRSITILDDEGIEITTLNV